VATLLRASRVMLIWMGIAAITMMINAGFMVATSGVRNHYRDLSQKTMLRGVVASVAIAIIFIGLTIALQLVS
ncbi:MAG: hypothetical protein P8J32_05005, partial [bacterium]|nr:hypothetical protein [bacterium]